MERYFAELLHPTVRVQTEKAGGSGTIVYSKLQENGKARTFALTCHHVVDSAIVIKQQWDDLLRKKTDKQSLTPVKVETFTYIDYKRTAASAYIGNILTYSAEEDLALVEIDTPAALPVAPLWPEDKTEELRLFTPVFCVGCSLLHDPIPNPGFITGQSDVIENRVYWMSNANSIFGNSGGAIYAERAGRYHLIGVPARITGYQIGFSVDIVQWMGFFVTPKRIYDFLREQECRFVFDETDTPAAAEARRKAKQDEWKKRAAEGDK